MGGGGGKSGGSDNSAKLYAQQQADLARQRAETDERERLAREEEQARRDALRDSMLGQRNVLASNEDATIVQNTLG